MTRTVELLIPQGELTEIAVTINTWDKLWEAIGYLSTWSADNYPIVRIFRDAVDNSGADLGAVYLQADGELGYVIGAVWHEDHYGFHS